MAFVYNQIILDNQAGTNALIMASDDKLSFSGVSDKYEFDEDVYAKNVKLANENDIQNLQSEIDSILPLSNYAYINGNDETSQLGAIPFGTGGINTLIQSPDFVYDNVNKVVKVDNVNLATQTQIDFLQTEIDNIPGGNPNVWINGVGQTTTNQQILFTDNSVNGAITSDKLYFDTENNFIYLNGEVMPVRSEIDFLQQEINDTNVRIDGVDNTLLNQSHRIDDLETLTTTQGNDIQTNTNNINILNGRVGTLEGQVAVQQGDINYLTTISQQSQTDITALQGEVQTLQTDVSNNTTNIGTLQGNVSDLQGDVSTLQGQISINTANINTNTNDIIELQGDLNNLSTYTSNSINNLQGKVDTLQTYANSALMRAINCNNWTPTTVYNVVWNNLTPTEKLMWKGGDNTTIDPVQSVTGNNWNFTKSINNNTKIGWYIPIDLSSLTFQDLESFWAVIRFNTTANISTEGSLYFSITTNPATAPNTFRTRFNYCNPATTMNTTGYFYKIFAIDTITTLTTANLGKGQEVGQQKFKLNPMNVRSDLWSIGFNKLVASPTGDTTAGYTLAPIQSISLQTTSNINTFNFDLVSIGYLDKQYNLFYS